jgi:hypothetical protein
MQHERIDGRTEVGDHEGHALGHEAGNERHIPAEPVQFGDDDRAFALARVIERRDELRPPIKGVGALAGFHLDTLVDDNEVVGFGEAGNGFALRLDSEARFGRPAVES